MKEELLNHRLAAIMAADVSGWSEIAELNPKFSLQLLRRVLPYRDPTWFERLAHGLRAAGLDVGLS